MIVNRMGVKRSSKKGQEAPQILMVKPEHISRNPAAAAGTKTVDVRGNQSNFMKAPPHVVKRGGPTNNK